MRTYEEVVHEVETFRKAWGHNVVSDPWVKGTIAGYTFMPADLGVWGATDGYMQEYDLVTGEERHCGLGSGCFWTDWA